MNLEELEESLWEVVSTLEARWVVFCQIYRQGPNTTNLLNSVAPGFFGNTQTLWLDHIAQEICKLLEGPTFGKRENLVLEQLIVKTDEDEYSQMQSELKRILKAARDATTRIRVERNRRIAHHDLEKHATNDGTHGFNYGELQTSLRLIAEFRRVFEFHTRKTHVFPEPPGNIYDGVAVVRACQRSRAFKAMVEDGEITRAKAGEATRNLDSDDSRFDPYEVQPLPWE